MLRHQSINHHHQSLKHRQRGGRRYFAGDNVLMSYMTAVHQGINCPCTGRAGRQAGRTRESYITTDQSGQGRCIVKQYPIVLSVNPRTAVLPHDCTSTTHSFIRPSVRPSGYRPTFSKSFNRDDMRQGSVTQQSGWMIMDRMHFHLVRLL